MLQTAPGDLMAVESEGSFYYALILDRIRLFGGNWTFVFHAVSDRLLRADDLLSGDRPGFHAFVDFIWAKRERRLARLARKVDSRAFQGPGRLKWTAALTEKARLWLIYDMTFKEVKRVPALTSEEAGFPLKQCIDDHVMVQRARERWMPELDARI